jgi:uncharacterized membrane protein YdjX (TVP38/TMEM64 family)
MSDFRRVWPLLLIPPLLFGLYATGLHGALSWSVVAARQSAWRAWADAAPISSAALYFSLYVVLVALSLPLGVWLTLAGGLLFGPLVGGVLALAGATAGATVLFLAMRSSIGPICVTLATRAGAGRFMDRARAGLQRDGFSYLLAMRLMPVVPFWLSTLAPGLVGMRLAPFVAATVLGMIPATAVFAMAGAGLAEVLARGEEPELSLLFAPKLIFPLFGLALLSLAPIAWRRWRTAEV